MQDLEQGLHGALQLCDGAKTIIDANFLRFLERSFETRIQQSHRYQRNSKNFSIETNFMQTLSSVLQ